MDKKYIVLLLIGIIIAGLSSCIDYTPIVRNSPYDEDFVSSPLAPTGDFNVTTETPHIYEPITFSINNIADDTTVPDDIETFWALDINDTYSISPGYVDPTKTPVVDFSKNKSIEYAYEKVGTFNVGVQLRDQDGDLRLYKKKITVRPYWRELVEIPDSAIVNSMAINPVNNRLQIAVRDESSSNKARVYEWDGSSWSSLGVCGTGAASSIQITHGPDGNPVLSFADGGENGYTHIFKYSSGSWDDLGIFARSSNQDSSIPLVVDNNNKPITVTLDGNVTRWVSGSTWENLGDINSTNYNMNLNYVSLVVDGNNTIFASFKKSENNKDYFSVYKYNNESAGQQWSNRVFSNVVVSSSWNSLFKGPDNFPVIYYYDSLVAMMKVKKYTGGANWSEIYSYNSNYGILLTDEKTGELILRYSSTFVRIKNDSTEVDLNPDNSHKGTNLISDSLGNLYSYYDYERTIYIYEP